MRMKRGNKAKCLINIQFVEIKVFKLVKGSQEVVGFRNSVREELQMHSTEDKMKEYIDSPGVR
jgi:hypothetical protein